VAAVLSAFPLKQEGSNESNSPILPSLRDTLSVPLTATAIIIGFRHEESGQDVSEHQSIRDIERDVLQLDGERVLGATHGFAGVVAMLSQRLGRLVPRAPRGQRSPLEGLFDPGLLGDDEEGALAGFAKALLRTVNRTESGHWSFALVQALCANAEHAVIVPDSAGAGPLTINLSRGPLVAPLGEGSKRRRILGWGLRAAVEASTTYDIYDRNCEVVLLRITATFTHSLALPLGGPCSPKLIRGDVVWDRLGGAVALQITAQPRAP
jgi:hypothetical protein